MASLHLLQSERVFLSPAVFSVVVSFYFPMHPCFPPCFLHASCAPSPPLWPSLSLLTQKLHCFDIWPNYLDNCVSCSCHTFGGADLYLVVSLCSTWPRGQSAPSATQARVEPLHAALHRIYSFFQFDEKVVSFTTNCLSEDIAGLHVIPVCMLCWLVFLITYLQKVNITRTVILIWMEETIWPNSICSERFTKVQTLNRKNKRWLI